MIFRLFVGLFASMGFFGMINMDACGMDQTGSNMSVFLEDDHKNINSIEITDMDQFRMLTGNRSSILQSVAFFDMEINKEFTNRFWDCFIDGVDILKFENCSLAKGYRFCDLFDGEYKAHELSIKSDDLSKDDMEGVIGRLYAYTVDRVSFKGKNLTNSDVEGSIEEIVGEWAVMAWLN